MSQRTLEAHYRPNWNLTRDLGLAGYNCGYAAERGKETFAGSQQRLVWRLLDDVAIRADSTVIDVGCGIGGPARWIVNRYRPRRLVAIEYLWSSVSAAETRASEDSENHPANEGRAARPIFVQADAHALPLANASADVIFNLESALHYRDKSLFIAECRRVLRPGGVLCLGDITTRYKWLFTPARLMNFLPSQFNSNARLWSARNYRRAFDAASFELLRHENASLPVAHSLADGVEEIMVRGLSRAHGYRARFFYLAALEKMLRRGILSYDLFALRRSR